MEDAPDVGRFLAVAEQVLDLKEFGQWKGLEPLPNGCVTMPHTVFAAEVQALLEAAYECHILFPFDWPGWDEGRLLLERGEFGDLDLLTLRKLLTALIRNDRFCEGVLLKAFTDGTIPGIVRAMRRFA